MSLSHEIVFPVDLNGDLELCMYAPGKQVILEKVLILPGDDEAKEAVNYTTIQILDKGADGAQNDEVCNLHTEDIATGVALTANVASDFSPSSPYTLNYGLTIKKTDAAAAVDIEESVIILTVRQV